MTVEEIDAIISQAGRGLAYIKAEEIDGTLYHVIHDDEGDTLAMSEDSWNLISFAATRGMTVCSLH
jgi:hypothetical protein